MARFAYSKNFKSIDITSLGCNKCLPGTIRLSKQENPTGESAEYELIHWFEMLWNRNFLAYLFYHHPLLKVVDGPYTQYWMYVRYMMRIRNNNLDFVYNEWKKPTLKADDTVPVNPTD